MKVLVIGAGGFLGSAVVEIVKQAGHEVYAAARMVTDSQIKFDLEKGEEFEQILNALCPEAIINCAAIARFDTHCLPILYPVNTLAPAIMASWCKKNEAYLCHVSGSLVHGIHTENINSTSPIVTDSDYGYSKWLAELLVRASGASAVSVRFGGIYGEAGPDHLSLNRILRAAKKGEVPVVYGKGLALRNYIHVMDAAKALLYCVENSLTGTRWCGGNQAISIAEMMRMVCEVYLPGMKATFSEGEEARDQLVELSPDMPRGLEFKEALLAY